MATTGCTPMLQSKSKVVNMSFMHAPRMLLGASVVLNLPVNTACQMIHLTLPHPLGLVLVPASNIVGHFSKRPTISPIKYPANSLDSSSVIDESDIQDFPEITSAPSLSTSSETGIWKGRFPMKYAIDMDNGFRAMELLSGGISKKFEDTFDTREEQEYKPPQKPNKGRVGSIVSTGKLELRHLKVCNYQKLKFCALRLAPGSSTQAQHIILAVDWEWVATPVGPCDPVTNVVRDLLDRECLELPSDMSHLVVQPRIAPPPLPTESKTPYSIWQGLSEEFDPQEAHLLWQMVKHDPDCDFRDYDPKLIVVNLLGDELYDRVLKRFHRLDLSEAIHYYGCRKLTETEAEDDVDPGELMTEDLEPKDLEEAQISVRINTQRLVQMAVLPMMQEDYDFEVWWMLPLFYKDMLGTNGMFGPIFSRTEETSLYGDWGVSIDTNHSIPAIGAPNALRVLLFVKAPASPTTLTTKQLTNNLIIAYLIRTYSRDDTISEIHQIFTSGEKGQTNVGRTPAQWVVWTAKVQEIMDTVRVPPSHTDERIAKQKLFKLHIAGLLGCAPAWASSCLEAWSNIKLHRQRDDVKKSSVFTLESLLFVIHALGGGGSRQRTWVITLIHRDPQLFEIDPHHVPRWLNSTLTMLPCHVLQSSLGQDVASHGLRRGISSLSYPCFDVKPTRHVPCQVEFPRIVDVAPYRLQDHPSTKPRRVFATETRRSAIFGPPTQSGQHRDITVSPLFSNHDDDATTPTIRPPGPLSPPRLQLPQTQGPAWLARLWVCYHQLKPSEPLQIPSGGSDIFPLHSRQSGDFATRAKSPLCHTLPPTTTTIYTSAGSKRPATPHGGFLRRRFARHASRFHTPTNADAAAPSCLARSRPHPVRCTAGIRWTPSAADPSLQRYTRDDAAGMSLPFAANARGLEFMCGVQNHRCPTQKHYLVAVARAVFPATPPCARLHVPTHQSRRGSIPVLIPQQQQGCCPAGSAPQEETSRHCTLLNRVEQEAHRPPLPLLHQLPQVEPESSGDDSDSEYLLPFSGSQKRRQNRQASLKAKKLKATKNKGTGAQVKSKIIGKATSSSSSLASSSRQGAGATQIHHKCPRCVGKPMKDQCVQIIYVQEHKCKDLIGAALTCADSNNRLKPKPPVPTRRKLPAPLRYLHPYKDLHMTEVKHRRRVYERCGKDIVHFVWRRPHKPDMLVGRVRFEAMSRPTLRELILNHRRVKVRAIQRRAEMQRWAYGKMTGGGNRQPNGGSRGDGYGPYACHNGDTPDDIRALFRGAVDTDVLTEVGSSIYPEMKTQLRGIANNSGANRFGRFTMSTYECDNYISCIHDDHDMGKEDLEEGKGRSDALGGYFPCAQITKENCGKHDYNFAYVRWGTVIQTQANTVWVFNGRHKHGTVMPSQSAMDNNGASKGKHSTKRGKDAIRADDLRREWKATTQQRLRL
ncbi:hypothetical protein C8R43DRAFT_958148 [Mycena crocata]|nr:hypothetical protein C8R43DRAFT_958148 [Mycena crocata]